MILSVLALVVLLLTAIPAWIFWSNLPAYRPPPVCLPKRWRPRVSVLIPARNEERSLRAAVEAALTSEGVELEVLVLDDHSEDATAAVVQHLAAQDRRVRLLSAPELPAGWCGKTHACWILAQHARYDLLLFVDADVRLTVDGLAQLAAFQQQTAADLVSGIPLQETRTLLERLVIPLIHFVLLGFLPISRMRRSNHPAYGAGCGQLVLVRRASYEQAGGHAAIRGTLHDGIQLPRSFRAVGLRTDLCDATNLARCRMYESGRAAWMGLAKNAMEGLGAPRLILLSTLFLLGQALPVGLLVLSVGWAVPAILPAAAATVCSYYPRLAGVVRFRQSLVGALLHPLGVLLLLAIQWYALVALLLGRPTSWKGRRYPQGSGRVNPDGNASLHPSRTV